MKTEPEQLHYPTIAPIEEDEITLRDLVLKIQDYWREIRRCWLTILLIALPFVAYFAYQAFTKPITYT
ncbi:MAG: hypothetical protein LH618_11970, partial [Saprospiraceae bacterium]|nr:hypothetical protein [Saprospiraceae bacterium]